MKDMNDMNDIPPVSERICLIIHPNPIVAEDLSEILHGYGLTGKSAETLAAIQPLGACGPALVVADMRLEDFVAFDLARKWLELGVPVILLRSWSEGAAVSPSGIHYLEQPFRTEDVVALLQHANVI